MAEPAHRLDDEPDKKPIYDNPGTAPSDPRPQLKVLEGGGESTDPNHGDLSPADPEKPGRGDIGAAEKQAGEPDGGSFYKGDKKPAPQGFLRAAQTVFGPRRNKILGGGAVAGGLIGLILFTFLLFPWQLVHLREITTREIGGVQGRVYDLGRGRVYSTMFFFDKEGSFSGYKETKFRRLMLENRKTKQVISSLNQNGYQVEFEKINGIETGVIKALKQVDGDGKIIRSIESTEDLKRAWEIRKNGELNNILRTVYPEESDRWYGKTAKQMYRRWGLTRTNWLKDSFKDKTGLTTVAAAEARFIGALRQHLFGTRQTIGFNANGAGAEKDKDGNPTAVAQQELGNSDVLREAARQAEATRLEQLADPEATNPLSDATSIATDSSSPDLDSAIKNGLSGSVTGALGKSLNVFGGAQIACEGKAALDSVEKGARVLRASQLMRYSMAILTMADAAKYGSQAVNMDEINQLMRYLNKKDKKGQGMFAASGMAYWLNENDRKTSGRSFSVPKNQKNEIDRYTVGGGKVGTIAEVNGYIESVIGNSSCKTVNNPFVQVGGFAIGIGAGIFTGGGSIIINTAASLGIGVIVNIAKSIAIDYLTPIIAGTVINGQERGTAIGNAFVAGSEILTNAQGANTGMRPLKKTELKTAQQSLDEERRLALEKASLFDRYISLENTNSLGAKAVSAYANIDRSDAIGSFSSILTSPFKLVNNLFLNNPALASYEESGCNDPEIVRNNLAASPFCTPIVGIPDSVLLDENLRPDAVEDKMIMGGFITPEGLPLGSYKDYLKQCTSNVPDGEEVGSDYRSIDIIHDSNNEYTDICSNDLFNMYRLYESILENDKDVFDTINGAATGNPSSLDTPSPSSGSVSGSKILGNPGDNSNNIPCAAGTKDLGVVTTKYTGQYKTSSGPLIIRLCQVSSIPGNGDGPSGANLTGGATVSSRISGAWMALGQAAKNAGVLLTSNSSFRLEDSCGGTGMGTGCAEPGKSPHQMGVAIDFAQMSVKGTSTISCSGRAKEPLNPSWQWLYKNADKFGIKQYTYESWHWDALPLSNRCGFGQ